MSEMDKAVFDSKQALPNKLLQSDGSVTDLAGNAVIGATSAYEGKSALPNKWLNPDGTYSTLAEIVTSMIDNELFIVVDELPASGETNKIYLLVQDDNKVIEYIWTNNKWNPVGMVEFDLNNYYTKDQITQLISSALTSAKDYADTLFASIEIEPQVFYWDGKHDQAGINFWNRIMLINDTTDVLVITGDTSSGINRSELIKIPKGYIKNNKATDWYNYIVYNKHDPFTSSYSIYTVYSARIEFTIENDVITAISKPTSSSLAIKMLTTDSNYSEPYEPQYPGSPATKKYVDDSISNNITNVLGGSY